MSQKQIILRDKLLILMDKKNLKAAEIARITGRSEGTISDLLNNKKQFTDKLLNTIQDGLKDYMNEGDLVQTRQFNKMWNIAASGKKLSDMRLVAGNTGVGKSVVFRRFAEENECCWYVKIDRKEMTWNRFLREVVTVMGIKMDKERKRYPTSYLLDKIVAFVEEKADADPMLIIDESEVAKNSLFKYFKNRRTATEGLMSITIVGITDVINRIGRIAGLENRAYRLSNGGYSYKWYPTKENSNIYTTFARRISVFRIDNISTDDIAAFCAEKGITNKHVIAIACERWWNYEEADKAVKRAQRMGIDLDKITSEEFELL